MRRVRLGQLVTDDAGGHEIGKTLFDARGNIHGLHVLFLLKKGLLHFVAITAIGCDLDQGPGHVLRRSQFATNSVGAKLSFAAKLAERNLVQVPEEKHEVEDWAREPALVERLQIMHVLSKERGDAPRIE